MFNEKIEGMGKLYDGNSLLAESAQYRFQGDECSVTVFFDEEKAAMHEALVKNRKVLKISTKEWGDVLIELGGKINYEFGIFTVFVRKQE